MSKYEADGLGSIVTESPLPFLPDNHNNQSSGNEQPQASKTCWKLPTFGGIFSALGRRRWIEKLFIASCVIAVSFDPLFFYIPYTSVERKCIGRDYPVQTVALVLRSITDIGYLAHILYHLHVAIKFGRSKVKEDESLVMRYESVSREQMGQFTKAFFHKFSWQYFLTDLLSILPLPQVLIVGSFFKIGGNDYLIKRKVLSGFLLLQYLPRTYRIYLSSPTVMESKLWLRGLFNLFLYVLASHVLGAFWYFFSIQRETSCWYRNCVAANNTESTCTFYCHGNTTAPLITPQFNTLLNEQCLLKVPTNMTDPPFDLGIFFDLLKNDMQGKINFPKKISYCFWWGLRNLSNFGTSLVTSTYMWENIFAVVISIVGLLLFLYLIGNVQSYIERATTKAENISEKLRKKKDDIENWMTDLKLDEDMKEEIRTNIKQKLEEDPSADLNDLYSLLPSYNKKIVKRIIGMRTFRSVPILSERYVDAKVLKLMCDYVTLKKYPAGTILFDTNMPLDRMVFVTEGIMYRFSERSKNGSHSAAAVAGEAAAATTTITTERLLSSHNSMDVHAINKGGCYGLELLQYASSNTNLQLPTLGEFVKCETKVEALVLTATDLRTIATLSKNLWPSFADLLEDQLAPLPAKSQQQQQQQQQQKTGLKKRAQSNV